MTSRISEELRRALYGARFDDAVQLALQIDPSALPCSESTVPDGEFVAGLKLRSMAAEVLDYWGFFEKARDMVAPVAQTCRRSLGALLDANKARPTSDCERQVLRQKVWILLHAGMAEYRRADFDRALQLFDICDRVCREHVVSSTDQAWGTRARIRYCCGLVFRERFDFDEALKCFTESVENAYRSLEKRTQELSKLTYVAIAKNLGLGLAFIHTSVGRPDLAFPLLVSAKSILQPLSESLISAYVDLIYANVLRGIGEDQHRTMDEVIERLRRCHTIFQNHHHKLYQARASLYLALAYLHRARPDETLPLTELGKSDLQAAETYAEGLHQYSEQSGDVRFGLYGFVLRSRIQRKRNLLQEAEASANRALEVASHGDGAFVDALLARGEARERVGNVRAAFEDFEEARSCTKNPRTAAICLLHLCRLHSRNGNSREAARRMVEFERLKSSVTHAQIRLLELQARAAMEQCSTDLVLRLTDPDLDAGKVEQRVRRFLVDWARARTASDSEASSVLRVSRQTFYNWAKPKPSH